MFDRISTIQLQGANFLSPTVLQILDSSKGNFEKISLIYGCNGSGKSTIAKVFRKISGEEIPNIAISNILDSNGSLITLPESYKTNVFVFDEDFVNKNVCIDNNGLDSIVMLGEQADLTTQIESAKKELLDAESEVAKKESVLNEYTDNSNIKSPGFYIKKMKEILSKGNNCWADRERKAKNQKRNSSVSDDTYKRFIGLSPLQNRDELIIGFNAKMQELTSAQRGEKQIVVDVPSIPTFYKYFSIETAKKLLGQHHTKPRVLKNREKSGIINP